MCAGASYQAPTKGGTPIPQSAHSSPQKPLAFLQPRSSPTRRGHVVPDQPHVREARNHVKVDMEDVLTTVPLVILANRNAIGTTHRLHCCCNAGECRHQRACEIAANLIDLCHVPGGYNEHMAPVTGLLMTAREHRGLVVAKCENSRR